MTITINGVDIAELQKTRSCKDNKKEAKKKTVMQKTPGRKRKPEPSSDQAGQMNRYIVRTAVEDNKVNSDRNQEQGQVLRKQEEIKTTVSDKNTMIIMKDNKKILNVNHNTMKKTFSSIEKQEIQEALLK